MKIFISIFFITFLAANIQAQQRLVRKAKLAKNWGDYYSAVLSYEEALAKGLELDETDNLELAGLYYDLGQYDKSVIYYENLSNIGSLSATNYFHYSHALEVLGDTSLKHEILARLVNLYPSDSRVQRLMDKNLVRNRSLLNDYHRLIDSVNNVINVIEYNGRAYGMRLGDKYDELVSLTSLLPDSLLFEDWDINQGGVCFLSPDHLIVTLNLNRKGKLRFYEDDRSSLQLYSLRRDSLAKWSKPNALSINMEGFNTANPAVSPDGGYLYFASDRPGGKGQTDIYKAAIASDGSFGEVEHLNEGINTEGKESHVFIDSEGIMYFSSDGYPGKGGLDVYAVDLNSNEVDVYNMGYPVNTVYDDFAYSRYGEKGYFSTDRDGYLATWAYDLKAPIALTDIVTKTFDLGLKEDVLFQEPVRMEVIDEESGEVVWNKTTDILSNSLSIENLEFGKKYRLEMDGPGSLLASPKRFTATHSPEMSSVPYFVELIPVREPEPVITLEEQALELERVLNTKVEGISADLGEGLKVTILFNHNSSFLTKRYNQSLLDLVTFLKNAKDYMILIEGHTDSIGENAYNQWLSEKRAKRVKEFLVEIQVPQKRISTLSFGEEMPIKDNKTVEGRRANRRVEIKVFLNSEL